MADPTDKELLEALLIEIKAVREEARLGKERQKVTARAVADLAIGLNSGERQARDRHQELLGIVMGAFAEKKIVERRRKDSEDQTDSFRIPGGQGHVELTRGAQRKLVKWVLLALAAIGRHAIQFAWEWLAEHRAKPTAEAGR